MTPVTLWHNPRCSKSRQALALLQDTGIGPVIRRYLDDAPSIDELRVVRDALGITAAGMMRTKEKRFAELGLTGQQDDDFLLQIMAENPALIERPIALAGGRAVIGRPPERVLDILQAGSAAASSAG